MQQLLAYFNLGVIGSTFLWKNFLPKPIKAGKPEFSYIPKEHTELIAAMKTGDEQALMEIIKVHIQ